MSLENHRYIRIESLKEIGKEGVEKLKKGKVLVIGCGALGSLCSMYLAASGVGTIGIADFDTIDITNLQRQLFFNESNLGQPKAQVLSERINTLNSDIKVILIPELITSKKACNLFKNYDFIVDGSDNPSTKAMTASTCEKLGKAYCVGGVREFSGQIMSWTSGHSGYNEIFGDIQESCGMTPCSIAGVIGPAAGVVASFQACEAIKYLCGIESLLLDSLFTFDLLSPSASIYRF